MNGQNWDIDWILRQIVPQFNLSRVQSIQSVGSGHINDSYHLVTDAGDFFLQRINHQVFRPVKELMHNMEQLLALMHQEPTSKYPRLIFSNAGENMVYDPATDTYWRMTTYIDGHTIMNTTDENIARQAGQAIAEFHQRTKTLNPKDFFPVIQDFHDMFWRYEQFYEVCAEDVENRLEAVLPLVEWVESMEDEMTALQVEVLQHHIPIQVVHNDTKLENILFDDQQEVICLIDLDTLMPGNILYDVGDTLRTLPINLPEDSQDINQLEISLPLTKAFLEGYLSVQGKYINEYELRWLPFAAPYMTFIMGIRFLTDYLAGDVYYKIKLEKHNLNRSQNQFALVKKWLDLQPTLQSFVQEYYEREAKSAH